MSSLIEVLCPETDGVSLLPKTAAIVRGRTNALAEFRREIVDLVSYPEADPHHERADNLVAEALAWLGETSSRWRPEGFTVNGATRRIARCAQDYIEANYRDIVRIAELCRATHVGVRTLQRHFSEYFDMTISDYVKAVRLNAARRQLVNADANEATVHDIAVRSGFTHLGRFSVDFRTRFGEYPRTTLAA